MSSTYKDFLTNPVVQVNHIKAIHDLLVADYAGDRATALKIIANISRIGATFTDGLLTQQIDEKNIVIIEDRILGPIRMLKFSGTDTVNGEVKLVELNFGIKVRNFLQFAHSQNKFVKINEGYRTYEYQKSLYDKYLAGGPLAASPETGNHRKGLAVDFDLLLGGANTEANWRANHEWILANAAQFGLFNKLPKSGRNMDLPHFSYNGS